MSRQLVILALCAAGCVEPRTEVVVIVHSYGITIGQGGDVDGLRILVKNDKADDSLPIFDNDNPLCGDSPVGACWALPVTATLVPGPDRPNDLVVVQVLGLRNGARVIGDQASFHFLKGVSQRLDFVLYANCLNVDCTKQDAACNYAGMCEQVQPMTFTGEPQLDGPPAHLLPDLGGVKPPDLLGVDLPAPPDMSGTDMSMANTMDMSVANSTDMSMVMDLKLADLRQPDLRKPDLLLPDLSSQDLSGQDMTPSDDMPVPQWADISPSLPPGTSLRGIWGKGSSDIYVVGDNGIILHSMDGMSWDPTEVSNTNKNLYAVWGDASDDVYAAGDDGTLIKRNVGTWTQQTLLWTAPNPFVHLRGVWGDAANDFFVVGNGFTLGAFDGTWAQKCGTNMNTNSFHAISAAGKTSLLVAGAGVGGFGEVHASATIFCQMSLPGSELGVSDMGCGGGCPLQPIYGPTGPELFGVSNNGSGGYVVGRSGTILFCTSLSCSPMANAHSDDLFGVWSEPPGGARNFAVGNNGRIESLIISGGPNWVAENSGVSVRLNAVWGENGGPVFAVGDNGTILRRD